MLEDLKQQVVQTAKKADALGMCKHKSGNFSIFDPASGCVVLSPSGIAREVLCAQQVCVLDLDANVIEWDGAAKPSSEALMHLAIYRTRPDCTAILHTHPRRLLALSLRLAGKHDDFLRLPLFEAEVWRAKLGFAPALPPGTTELAEAVAEAAKGKDAVWMAGHGLCCLGRNLGDALCLAEELEHLAALQILATA